MKAVRLTVVMILGLLLAASAAYAETCEYDTEWGVVTLTYNWNNNSVTGDYPYKSGQPERHHWERQCHPGTMVAERRTGPPLFFI